MPNGNSLSAEYDRHIRGRLRELTSTHPQAEIARKTGISKPNVHRYLHGNRVPASLCAAIIENLGVDPGWLMVGRGRGSGKSPVESPPVGTSTANLMDLVNAMNQAARLHLGALRDKRELQTARELSDTLTRYEQTRAALSGLSREMLRRVLDQWHVAYQQMKPALCATLRESAGQLIRLCDDEALRLEHTELEANTEGLFGDERKALELQRRMVTQTLLRPGGLDDAALSRVSMLVALLESSGRLREALRIGRAVQELVSGTRLSPTRHAILLMNIGSHSMDLGDLEAAMRALRLAVSTASRGTRSMDYAQNYWMLAQYWAGACDFDGALGIGKAWWARAEFLLLMGLWQEEPRALRIALAEYKQGLAASGADGNTESITARWCLRAVKKPGAALAGLARRDLHRRQPPETAYLADRFAVEVYEAQVAWLARQKVHAARMIDVASRTLEEMQPDQDPVLLGRALYHRLVVRLGHARMGERHAESRRFFEEWTARGYARFAGVLD